MNDLAESPSRIHRAALVEEWGSLRKGFAFALAADDFATNWLARFTKAEERLLELSALDVDIALFLLIQNAIGEFEGYSTNHSLLCAVIAELCAAHFEWPEADAASLRRAALTMNVGMLLAQNQMALQVDALSPAQRCLIDAHPAKSVELLESAGVSDSLWLDVVRRHHRPVDPDESNGPVTTAQRLAQMLQRIDVFTAKLSRRRTRMGSSAIVAARDACLDGSGLPDALGATMLRVMGLYPPGSFVELEGGEICVVTRRGAKAHTPLVACLRRADGGLANQPEVCDTALKKQSIKKALSVDDVKVRVDHSRVLKGWLYTFAVAHQLRSSAASSHRCFSEKRLRRSSSAQMVDIHSCNQCSIRRFWLTGWAWPTVCLPPCRPGLCQCIRPVTASWLPG